MQAGDARDGGDHQAGEQLHGCDVALIESAGRRGQHLENAESAAVVAQGRNQYRADSEAATAGEVDARVALGVVAEHDFAGTDGFGRNSGVSLQADSKVGSGAAGTGAANNFVSSAEGDGGSGGSGQMLGAFGDCADGWLEIEFGGMDFDFFSQGYGPETRHRMRGIGDAQLAALRQR